MYLIPMLAPYAQNVGPSMLAEGWATRSEMICALACSHNTVRNLENEGILVPIQMRGSLRYNIADTVERFRTRGTRRAPPPRPGHRAETFDRSGAKPWTE